MQRIRHIAQLPAAMLMICLALTASVALLLLNNVLNPLPAPQLDGTLSLLIVAAAVTLASMTAWPRLAVAPAMLSLVLGGWLAWTRFAFAVSDALPSQDTASNLTVTLALIACVAGLCGLLGLFVRRHPWAASAQLLLMYFAAVVLAIAAPASTFGAGQTARLWMPAVAWWSLASLVALEIYKVHKRSDLAAISRPRPWLDLAFAVALVGLSGRLLQCAAIVQAGTNTVPMQFNTGLVLLFLALVLRQEGKALKLGTYVGLVVPVGLACLSFTEEIGWTHYSVAQWIWSHRIDPEAVAPGRVAISTAVAALLLAVAALVRLLARHRPMVRLVEWGCGLMVLVIGLLTLLGYLSGLLDVRIWGTYSPMALLTAVSLVLLGVAVLLRGSVSGGDWATRAIVWPTLSAVAICMLASRLWLAEFAQTRGGSTGLHGDTWILFSGLFTAALFAVAFRFGLLAHASSRSQAGMSAELRQRNRILGKMVAGLPRDQLLGELLTAMRAHFPHADVSIVHTDEHGVKVNGSALARQVHEQLDSEAIPYSTNSDDDDALIHDLTSPIVAQQAGYSTVHRMRIRTATDVARGVIQLLISNSAAAAQIDEAYLRASASIAGLVLQRDDVMLQMQQSQDRYRSLVDNHPDAVLQLDAKGIISAANAAAMRLFDRTNSKLTGEPLAGLLDSASANVLEARLHSVLHGHALELEASSALQQRRKRELELTLVPLRAQAGEPGMFAIARDVSRYRAADRALRRTHEQTLEFRDRLIELNRVAVALAGHTEIGDLLQYLATQMQSGFNVGGVRLVLDPENSSEPSVVVHSPTQLAGQVLMPAGLHQVARANRTPRGLSSVEIGEQMNLMFPIQATVPVPRNWLAMALVMDGGEPIGTVELFDRRSSEFDDDDESLLVQFAQLTVGAVLRARLLQGLRQAQSAVARQLAFVRAMAGSIVDGLYAVDQAGRLSFMNPAAAGMLGIDAEEEMGRRIEVRMGGMGRNGEGPGTRALATGEFVEELTLPLRSKAGDAFVVDLLASPMQLDGETIGAVVVFRDIGERLRAEEARTVRDQFFELSLELFIITDKSGKLLQTNAAVTRLVGPPLGPIEDRSWSEFVHEEDRQATRAVAEQLLTSGRLEGFVNRWVDVRGETHWMEWTAAVAPDQRIFAVARDISERHHYESEIAHFSTHDSLTGLPRIEQIEAYLILALAAAAQSGTRISVFYVDLDRFHAINDARGRLVGDGVLRVIAQRLSATHGEHGKVCRIAGDEFVLVMLDPADGPDQQEQGEVLRLMIEEPISVDLEQVYLTCSIGVSCFPENGATAVELIRQAEAAMMRAKEEGRNGVAAFSNDELQALLDRRELGSGLRDAIRANELVLHFQPQISAHNWQVNGVEALVRWQHPVHGLLLPGRFISVAEELGVIVELGQWVLESACHRAREWLDSGLADFTVAVNVSALQLQRPDFLERVQRALEISRLPPRYLELELTESMVMAHVERVIMTMRALKALGVSISLDDFGSGYSSLSYLRRFPIDKLKIDQSFVRDITTDPGSAGICRAVIGLGHQLGMTVSAEGVETIGQAGFLRRSECDQFQGNYFSFPLPAQQAFDVLRRRYLRQEELGGSLQQSKVANTLLLLDDEENVIRALVRLLRRDGYTIITASNADQAFELLASQPVQVIISDQRMPDMSGTDFLHKVKELYPDTVRLILSGYSDFASLTDAINRGAVYRFVPKPWDDEELRRTIREAFRIVDSRQAQRVV